MVLLVQGQVVLAAELAEQPSILAANQKFLAQQLAELAELAGHADGTLKLYASQGECQILETDCPPPVGAAAPPVVLCSSDATTCIIAALVPTGPARSGATARIVHHDQATTGSTAALQATVAGLEPPAAARLWLAGGYADAGGVGDRVARPLLEFLQRCSALLHVQLCCIGRHNTLPDGAPRCTALALDVRTLSARPAAPPLAMRGPLLPARMAQWAYHVDQSSEAGSSSPLHTAFYSPATQQLRLTLRHGRPPPFATWYAAEMVELEDAELLQRCSTSPDHEPPHCCADMRASFRWLLEQTQAGPEACATHAFLWEQGRWGPLVEAARRRLVRH